MNTVFLRHVAHESGGRFERAAAARGWRTRTLDATDAGAVQAAAAADLLVVLGGPMGVYEADRYPFLAAELALLRARLAARRPVIGVCLGAQLIAAAAGAKVYPGDAGFEVGYGMLTRAPGADGHPLGRALPEAFPALHWHGDTFDPPPGATLLASSPRYPQQIFAVGDYALGLQCHLEVGREEIEAFVTGNAGDLARDPAKTPARIEAEAAANEADVDAAFTALWSAFAAKL